MPLVVRAGSATLRTATPGAKRSTQEPKFENVARASARSVAATVSTSGTRPGDASHASVSVFPAAATYVIPVSIDRRTAASSASDATDVALTVATAGWIAFAVTQSMPASTCDTVPVPAQSSTRIDTSDTAGALPLVVPPIAPATSVPCRAQSSLTPGAVTTSTPSDARPWSSGSARSMLPSSK